MRYRTEFRFKVREIFGLFRSFILRAEYISDPLHDWKCILMFTLRKYCLHVGGGGGRKWDEGLGLIRTVLSFETAASKVVP